jgi:aerobic carbon-monoxide dehydrogenase medium subunit
MIPAPFEYEAADSAEHAVQLLGQFGDEAKLLAGGHSLLPLMKQRLARPSALVDISRVKELSYVREDGDGIAVGALTCHEDVHSNETLREGCPILAYAAGEVGDPQVRNRGTIGGTTAHGDPASDIPTILLALGAEIVVRGPDGERTADAENFFKGLFDVDLSPQEMVTEIRVPKSSGTGWSYQKFHHRAQDWATVGVAALLRRSNGTVEQASVTLTSMGETPLRARAVEEAITSGADPTAAAQEAAQGTNPVSDPLGSAEYRREMVVVFAKRALEEALSR